MAGKPLNKKNLVDLGAETLAELLLEAVKGDASRQRRVRMVLSADQGPEAITADVRKRFASIRRGRSFISRKAQIRLAKELAELTQLIESRIARDAPDAAFDLLWAQLHLAPAIHERTDDSWGTIGEVMDSAMEAISRLAPGLSTPPEPLAEALFEAIADDGYGAFDHAEGCERFRGIACRRAQRRERPRLCENSPRCLQLVQKGDFQTSLVLFAIIQRLKPN